MTLGKVNVQHYHGNKPKIPLQYGVKVVSILFIRQVSQERAALEDLICETNYVRIPLRSTVYLIQNVHEKLSTQGIRQALHIQHFWT